MRRVFADAVYWIARISPRDQWHAQAVALGPSLRRATLVTTDEVLDEVLAHFRGFGPTTRLRVVQIVRTMLTTPSVEVIPQSRDSFLAGLALYEARPDKGYSLTDCISMETMRQQGLAEILTHDTHFAQEGFIVLM
jgi:predicted nucleic acid-binding protein